jgi:protein involved in temperature-dependent protein secretion
VFDDALTDPAKRTYMTDEKVRLYGEAARRVPGFLYRDDTTAATLTATNEKKRGESDTDSEKAFAAVPVDVGALAAGCAAAVAETGTRCSSDGVHASRAVYDTAAQVIANVVVAHAVAR